VLTGKQLQEVSKNRATRGLPVPEYDGNASFRNVC